ncbi:MAG TPA: HEAT repeat domain-containing protein, partial [Cyclobacteriaceae bacterium]|nr:HEAT repeat domain-containing protein [Cyclobacteriaceae bacterium]
PEVEDPRGLDLNWEEMSAGELVSYLSDERFVVRDKAIEALVLMGEAAVADLTDALNADDERLRTDAVFALYRINTETSIEGVRSALEDPSAMVRTAAVRALGLEKDSRSLEKIMEMAQNDQAGVRRQAATALGQLGEQRAVPALLTAAEDPGDRFVEHAIIHSLTLLKAPQPLLEALDQGSANVKKAAVIALDQMDGSPLRQEHLSEFLQSGDKTLRSTGIWLAGHHPEWADVVVDFFRNSLAGLEGSEEDLAEVEDLMVTFSTDKRMQQFIAAELANSATPESRKLMLMGVIRRSPLEELPNLWIQPLNRLLSGGEERIRSGILDLIGSRNIVAMEKQVNQIIHDPATPADFRLKALNARILIRPQLSGEEFAMVLGFMSSEHDSPVRQSASRLLARAELDDAQLLELANNEIQNADLFLLPSLVDAFQGNKTPEVGEALIQALNNSTDRLDNLSEQDLRSLFDSFPEPVQASAKPLLATLHQRHADRLARLQELEDKLGDGDVGEGRKLFFGKSACSTCHAVGPEGGDFGPDLTNIGEIRSRHDILEAIVYPNASFAREYETFRVVTNNNTYTGVIAEQYPDAILVTIGPGPGIRIPRTDIVEIEPHGVSMMPPGLDQQLSEEEMSDLVAFLEALPYTVDRIIEARRD